jgi:hypothetical protein
MNSPPTSPQHWQVSASFLDIVMHAWPKFLRGTGHCAMRRCAASPPPKPSPRAGRAKPPAHPVIVVGSTGAGAATRRLMQAALDLPAASSCLPASIPTRQAKGWKPPIADAASHPQHVLHETLQMAAPRRPARCAHGPQMPRTVGNRAPPPASTKRSPPPSRTSDWTIRLAELAASRKPRRIRSSLEALERPLRLIEAEDESEEALAAALLLRETLETPGRTVALVTPESSLARRVAAILERWGIDIAPSSGAPLPRIRKPEASCFSSVALGVRSRRPGPPARRAEAPAFASVGRAAPPLSGIVTRDRAPQPARPAQALARSKTLAFLHRKSAESPTTDRNRPEARARTARPSSATSTSCSLSGPRTPSTTNGSTAPPPPMASRNWPKPSPRRHSGTASGRASPARWPHASSTRSARALLRHRRHRRADFPDFVETVMRGHGQRARHARTSAHRHLGPARSAPAAPRPRHPRQPQRRLVAQARRR